MSQQRKTFLGAPLLMLTDLSVIMFETVTAAVEKSHEGQGYCENPSL